MLDPEAFLTELYVLADECCTAHLPPARRPGPPAALAPAEVLTLAVFGQWAHFPSEAAFYRWATKHLRGASPALPSRPQLHRAVRRCQDALTACALPLGQGLAAADDRACEVGDGTGVRTRNAKRRGAGGLAGLADIGKCTRLGWYEGVRLLLDTPPRGAVTGWGLGPASTNDRVLAETFFAARAVADPGLPGVGRPTSDRYVAGMGSTGAKCQARWARDYGAVVVCPPQSDSTRRRPKPLRTWLAGIRPVIESGNDRLLATFRLETERPHDLGGLLARLAAKAGLRNACLWLNRTLGRPDLAVAALIDW